MATSTPVQSSPAKADFGIFELRYRKGGLLHTVFFKWADKEGAIEKAKEYCDKRQLRFIYLNDWLQDIQKLIEFEPDEGFRR